MFANISPSIVVAGCLFTTLVCVFVCLWFHYFALYSFPLFVCLQTIIKYNIYYYIKIFFKFLIFCCNYKLFYLVFPHTGSAHTNLILCVLLVVISPPTYSSPPTSWPTNRSDLTLTWYTTIIIYTSPQYSCLSVSLSVCVGHLKKSDKLLHRYCLLLNQWYCVLRCYVCVREPPSQTDSLYMNGYRYSIPTIHTNATSSLAL